MEPVLQKNAPINFELKNVILDKCKFITCFLLYILLPEVTMSDNTFTIPFFVKGDFDGFIGLFIDNLVNLLIITGLCLGIGMPNALVFGTILPGTAFSILAGNIFYSWQARKLAIKEKRDDVTALPYGINTVTLFAFFFLIITPIYMANSAAMGKEAAALLAWKIGVISCLVSGIFEGIGAFIGEKVRKITPRAALLSTLAGIALVFIALQHTIKLWDKPLIAFIPLALILIEYFSHIKLPFKIPAGLYALIIGGIIAWSTNAMDPKVLSESTKTLGFYLPSIAIFSVFKDVTFAQISPYLSIIIPMGLMSFLATIQNLESAAAAGDNFNATPSLAMNGIGTIVGAIFGSPFPTTVYIGHPGWKGLGARSGYSILNGAVVTILCLTGIMSIVKATIPLEAGYPILLWIGVVITAQAFQTSPKEHAPAIAIGIMPAIAAWGLVTYSKFIGAHMDKFAAFMKQHNLKSPNEIFAKTLPELKGLIAFQEGFMFFGMFITAVTVYLINKDFLKAFLWSLPLVVLSFFGFIHSQTIGILPMTQLTIGYIMFSGFLLLVHIYNKKANR